MEGGLLPGKQNVAVSVVGRPPPTVVAARTSVDEVTHQPVDRHRGGDGAGGDSRLGRGASRRERLVALEVREEACLLYTSPSPRDS